MMMTEDRVSEVFVQAVITHTDLRFANLMDQYDAADLKTKGVINWVLSQVCGYALPTLMLMAEKGIGPDGEGVDSDPPICTPDGRYQRGGGLTTVNEAVA
jgi:Cys-tRNA synthase (O-phospho-L-seryl-tRNA:Cys-tRNA synthase)